MDVQDEQDVFLAGNVKRGRLWCRNSKFASHRIERLHRYFLDFLSGDEFGSHFAATNRPAISCQEDLKFLWTLVCRPVVCQPIARYRSSRQLAHPKLVRASVF